MMTRTSPFLKKLPLELRIEIYKLLLVNEDLSDVVNVLSEVEASTGTLENSKYGLSPAILRTCRQIHFEASSVLYGNTFAISIDDPNYNRRSDAFPSPLTRYSFSPSRTPLYDKATYKRLRTIPAVSSISRWRYGVNDAVSSWMPMETWEWVPEYYRMLLFCRAMCHTPLEDLTISIYCKKCHIEDSSKTRGYPAINTISKLEYLQVLEPLKILRNIKNLKFECTGCKSHDIGHITEDEELAIVAAAQSNTPLTHVFEEYDRILVYSRAFERWESFKDQMGDSPSFLEEHIDSWAFSPYHFRGRHPVEGALVTARGASDACDQDLFESSRQSILALLEPHYKRVSILMDQLVAFVKSEKVVGGLLGNEIRDASDPDIKIRGQLLLEDLAVAFQRDLTPEIRVCFRRYPQIADDTYKTMVRERTLEEMKVLLLDEERHSEWKECFKSVGADMDKQWLEIRKARRALFDYGPSGTEVESIDVETWRNDDAIVWDVMEPDDIGARLLADVDTSSVP